VRMINMSPGFSKNLNFSVGGAGKLEPGGVLGPTILCRR
jgi:hypothetical protein